MRSKKILSLLISFALVCSLCSGMAFAEPNGIAPAAASIEAEFDLVVEVLEWGSATTAVVIDMGVDIAAGAIGVGTFSVRATTNDPGNNALIYDGPRTVTKAYVSASNAKGAPSEIGRYVVLELKYGFNNTNAEIDGCAAIIYRNGNNWLRQAYTVTQEEPIDGIYAPVACVPSGAVQRPYFDLFELVENPVEGFSNEHYEAYIPDADGPLPLVLWNHGGGETYNAGSGGNEGSQLFANMGGIGWIMNAPEDCVVVAPQRGTGAGAPGYSQPGLVAYLKYLVELGIVDGDRIYVTGCSAGGQETDSLIANYPELWAAALPICPAGSVNAASAASIASGGFPVWLIGADDDATVRPTSVDAIENAMKAADVDVYRTRFEHSTGTEIPNDGYDGYYQGHWSWVMVLNNWADVGPEKRGPIIDWLFAQSRGLPKLADGATFVQVDGTGVDGSKMYVYTASELHNPPPMLTPILYMYADKGFATQNDALKYINSKGLIALAEAEKAAVIVMNPVDGAWGEQDVAVYKASHSYVSFMGNAARLSYLQLLYAIGEGSGATFINQHLSQNADRIAAVLTVGGEMPDGVAPKMALPAYIAGGTQAAVDFYKAANQADTPMEMYGNPGFYCATNDIQRVVVDDGATAFSAAALNDAWKCVLRRTARQSVESPCMFNNNWATSTEVFTLMDRPMIDELGLTMIDAGYNWTASNTGTGWFEWVPDEAFDPANTKKFPLVISLHGSNDHPIYEAESNGWVGVAGRDRIIVAAPITETGAYVDSMIDTLIEKYPIDESRIYVTGFSLGANNTFTAASYANAKYGSYARFAGMAPMDPPGAGSVVATEGVKIPFVYTMAGIDQYGTSGTPRTFRYPQTIRNFLAFNGMAEPEGVADPFWTVATQNPETVFVRNRTINTATYYDSDDVPLVKLITGVGMDHAHFVSYGDLAWEHLRQFSRDLETKEVIYSPNPVAVDATFDLNVEVLEWGSATTAAIIDLGAGKSVKTSDIDKSLFSVHAHTVMPRNNSVIYDGPRTIANAYASEANAVGVPAASGRYIVLEFRYGFNNTNAEIDGCAAIYYSSQNYWLAQTYTITASGLVGVYDIAATQGGTITPIYDDFELVSNPVAGYTGQTYRVYIPDGATGPLPMVLWSHGAGEQYSATGGGNEGAQLFANMGGVGWVRNAPEDCVVIAPQRGLNGYSQAGVIAYINYLISQGIVDKYRCYASGCSMGGQETDGFLANYPAVWAAAIPICPAGSVNAASAASIASGGFPVWLIGAEDDTTVRPTSVDAIENAMAAGGVDVYRNRFAHSTGTEIPNDSYTGYYQGHWSWVMVLNNVADIGPQQRGPIIDWLFAQDRFPNKASITVAPDTYVSLGAAVSIPFYVSAKHLYNASVVSGELAIADSRFNVSVATDYPGASVVYNAENGKFTLFKMGGFADAAKADLITATLTLKAGASLDTGDTVSAILGSISFSYAFGSESGTSPSMIANGTATTRIWKQSAVPGDINGDGKVDGVDLAAALDVYGKRAADADWYSSGAYIADINGDGLIDMADIMVIAYLSVQ